MKILMIAILLATPFMSICQNKIDGVGPFRIGKTISNSLDQIASDNNIKINYTSTSMERYLADGVTYKTTKNIFLLTPPNEDEIEDSHYKYSKNVKVYLIDYMEISGVPFSELYLSFFNDTLYSIYSNGSNDIIEAMTTKYGSPSLEVTKKKVKCTSRLTGNFDVEEASYVSQWTTGSPAIKAVSHVGVFYNSKCEKLQYSYFSIENELLKKKITVIEEKLKKEKEAENKEKSKKALSNF